jgi:hypothetical protein
LTAKAKRRVRLFLVTLASGIVVGILVALDVSQVTMAVATTLDAAVPGGVALLDEVQAEREAPGIQRAEELSGGTVTSDPWRLVAVLAVALVAVERVAMVIFAIFYAAFILAAAGGDTLSCDDVVATTVTYSFPISVPVVIVASLLLARHLAYRIPKRAFAWTLGALLMALGIDIVLVTVVARAYDLTIDVGVVAKLYAILLVPEMIAAWVGTRWAKRDRGAYLIARLYKGLVPQDQQALVDLARSVRQID